METRRHEDSELVGRVCHRCSSSAEDDMDHMGLDYPALEKWNHSRLIAQEVRAKGHCVISWLKIIRN